MRERDVHVYVYVVCICIGICISLLEVLARGLALLPGLEAEEAHRGLVGLGSEHSL